MTEPKIDAELIERLARKLGGYAEGYGQILFNIWFEPSTESRYAVVEFKFDVVDFVMTHYLFHGTLSVPRTLSERGIIVSVFLDGKGYTPVENKDWFTAILLAADALPPKQETK